MMGTVRIMPVAAEPLGGPKYRATAVECMSGVLTSAKHVLELIKSYKDAGRVHPEVLERMLKDHEDEMNVLFEKGLKEMARERALPHYDPFAPAGPLPNGIPYGPDGTPWTPEGELMEGWKKCDRCGSAYALVAESYHETTCPPVKAKLDCLLPDPTEKLPK